jgi:hypothetical protein
MPGSIKKKINGWIILGALVVTTTLICVGLFSIWIIQPMHAIANVNPTAIISIIKAPTLTPSVTQVPLIDQTATQQALSPAGINIGNYVQITGTGGQGLRLRSGPGKGNPLLFLGFDSEVFLVKDGPQTADDITWWYLVAPYDEKRSGWAASNYLSVVSKPFN